MSSMIFCSFSCRIDEVQPSLTVCWRSIFNSACIMMLSVSGILGCSFKATLR
jgi:hypothetical protein